MTKAKTLESRGNVFTLFTGCAQIYHQRWYVCSPRGKFHLHSSPLRFGRRRADVHRTSCALRRALSALRQPKGETTIPLRKPHLLPFSELCVQIKAKEQPLSAHKVYECAPLLYRQN
ncbi:MAG: hypothetical protein HFG29_09545 [Eubacterium sp.]|nr:hypothetical protein [Eubacterium sp.]